MSDKKENVLLHVIPQEIIERKIFLIRGKKTMLDRDLADLYAVKPIALRQQVKRNMKRFPGDFMFQLTVEECEVLLSQSVIPSKQSLGGHLPYAFTEQGVTPLWPVPFFLPFPSFPCVSWAKKKNSNKSRP